MMAVLQSLERAHVVYFMHVSAASVYIYDYLTSFADEVAIVWPTGWHAGKVLFLLMRYTVWPELLLTLYIELFDVGPKLCRGVFTYITWSTTVAIVVTEMILVLRTWALWGASRRILISLVLLLAAVTAADAVNIAYYINHTVLIPASDAIPVLRGCVISSTTDRLAVPWILVTSFELLIVVLTLIPGIRHFRAGHSSNLIRSLYRDGILYFIYLFSLSLANLMFIYTAPDEYVALFGTMQRAFTAMLSCKIIMHLQSASLGRTALSLSGECDASTGIPMHHQQSSVAWRYPTGVESAGGPGYVVESALGKQRASGSAWNGAS